MNDSISRLKNLNEISKGIHKRWIWGSAENYHKSSDYLQKINYSIQDLNTALSNGLTPSMKDVIFIIVLVDWIKEACECIEKTLLPELIQGFSYHNDDRLGNAKQYFTAVRSFVVAHPLNTSRHQKYGLDGNKICVDIQKDIPVLIKSFIHDSDLYHLDINGLHPKAKNEHFDFVLYIYDKEDNNSQFFQYIGCNYADILLLAEIFIDKLYCLAEYLNKQKMKDYKNEQT